MEVQNKVLVLDPRQSLTIALYRDPKSETFANLKQSMISAGFDDEYANSIAGKNPAWLSELVKGDVEMIQRAEKNLKKYLNIDIQLKTKLNVDIAKLQVDVSKFVLKTIAKQKYSENEKDSTPPQVQINIVNYNAPKTPTPSTDPVIHDVSPDTPAS